MLKSGNSIEDRERILNQFWVPEYTILEFVKQSVLAPIPRVKGVRARLYYYAGPDAVEKARELPNIVEYKNDILVSNLSL
jgi:hypothetical protein